MKLQNLAAFQDKAVLYSSVLAFVLYLNTLNADFVYDDSRTILTNPDVTAKSSWFSLLQNDFWGTSLRHKGSHGSYRPVTVATFRLTASAFGLSPFPFHLGNILLHSVATALVAILARKVLRDDIGTYFASLIFASHPIHCEAVANVVGRADIISGIFFLLSLLANDEKFKCEGIQCGKKRAPRTPSPEPNNNIKVKRIVPPRSITCNCCSKLHLLSSVIFSGIAMLSKETGIMVLPMCILWDAAKYKISFRRMWQIISKGTDPELRKSWLFITMSLAVLVNLRISIAGGYFPVFASADNPASRSSSLLTRLLTFLYLPVVNFILLVYPRHLSFDWSMDSIPLIESIFDSRNLLSLLFYTSISIAVWNPFKKFFLEEHYREKFQSLGILVVAYIPATNLFFYVGFVIAERVLYIPSIGYSLLLGLGSQKLYKRTRNKNIVMLMLIVLVTLSWRTFLRNQDWYDEESLYKSGIPYNPPKSWGNLGNIFAEKGLVKEAEFSYKMAVHHRPNMADVYYNLGILLQNQDRLEEAIICYRSAIQCRPSLILAYLNLGIVLSKQGKITEAMDIFKTSLTITADSVRDWRSHESARTSALLQIGRIYSDKGEHELAIQTYTTALKQMPDHYQPQSLYNLLGESCHKLGQDIEAEHWFQMALGAKPDHVPAYLTYGKMLARNESRLLEAEAHLRRAQVLAPSDSSVNQHLGQFLMEHERYKEAAAVFRMALEQSPHDSDLLSALGHALKEMNDLNQAEIYFRRAAAVKPSKRKTSFYRKLLDLSSGIFQSIDFQVYLNVFSISFKLD
ncbi:protein O-mannosyl-transferase Tmtc2-like isoform X3 [Artemia franciscana]|uniref:protein O-mannosyl-transferase Tmtc2-like isoform X3 n=1 Tax=Artemia franciscana TaxID=6661 RepID=UPI0032DB909F